MIVIVAQAFLPVLVLFNAEITFKIGTTVKTVGNQNYPSLKDLDSLFSAEARFTKSIG